VYYVWETRRRTNADVIAPQFAPTLKEQRVSFLAGRRFPRPLPELEIRFEARGQFALTDDFVIRRRRCLVHSYRLAEVLRRVGVDNIDYYACRLVNAATNAIYRTHQAANILDVIYCMDSEKSDLDIDDEEPNEIWSINRLKLIEERLGDSLLFRLGERPSTVLVDERVKEAVERAGLSGPVFLPADGYREYPGSSSDPNNVIGPHDLDPDGPADAVEEDDAEQANDNASRD